MKKRINTVFFVAFMAFILTFLTACQRKAVPESPKIIKVQDKYIEVLEEFIPNYEYDKDNSGVFSSLKKDGIAQCYCVQATSLLLQNDKLYWYPQYLSTAVIAVDLDKTDAKIEGWQDLKDCGIPISLSCFDQTAKRLILTSLCYGLEGKDYTEKSTLEFLRELKEKGLFLENDLDAPIQICFDNLAVYQHRQGKNLKIIVPKEGTFSFAVGILSNQEVENLPTPKALLSSGFRLLDGQCQDESYPKREEYRSAVRLTNRDRFLKQTESILSDVSNNVFGTQFFISTVGKSSILSTSIAIILTFLWRSYGSYRAITPKISKIVTMMACMIVMWLELRIFRYLFDPFSAVSRYCRCFYFFFQIGLPILMLYLSVILGSQNETEQKLPKWFYYILIPVPIFFFLIFTNDYHALVFEYQMTAGGTELFHYGYVCLIIYIYCLILYSISTGIMINKSRKSPRISAWVYPTAFFVIFATITVIYFYKKTFSGSNDFTIVFCFLDILFFELVTATDLFPTNSHYRSLFVASPFDMQLLDKNGNTALKGRLSTELTPQFKSKLMAGGKVTILGEKNKVFHSAIVHGGKIVWQEDISVINDFRKEQEETLKKLKARENVLQNEEAISRRKMEKEKEIRLLSLLRSEISEKTNELRKTINCIPEDIDKREKTYCYIVLLLCHIKRRCNLFFLAREGQKMPVDELEMYIDELSEFGNFAKVNSLCRSSADGEIGIRQATLIYDFFFEMLAHSVRGMKSTLICSLKREGEVLQFYALTSEAAEEFSISEEYFNTIKQAGGELKIKPLEDETGFYLCFKEEERQSE